MSFWVAATHPDLPQPRRLVTERVLTEFKEMNGRGPQGDTDEVDAICRRIETLVEGQPMECGHCEAQRTGKPMTREKVLA